MRLKILPKSAIYQSLMIELIIALPFLTFFVFIMLGVSTEPNLYGGDYSENRSVLVRLTILHMWFAIFSSAAVFSCMGALVSYSSREIHLDHEVDTNAYILSLHIVGSIFGIILLLMFIGGFIAGNLFPNFGYDLGAFTIYSSFHSVAEWAKLFIWSFVAGFSERLVPTLLLNLSKKLENSSIE